MTRELTRTEYISDLPDASLVVPCDTTQRVIEYTTNLVSELTGTRDQRDECASRMTAVARWRAEAVARAEKARADEAARLARLASGEDK